MALVVDDHLLIDLLASTARGWLELTATQSAVYTTGSWYYRVASAADHGSGKGSLSGRVGALDEQDRVAPRREPDGAQLTTRHDAALEQRLQFMIGQINADELHGLAERNLSEPELGVMIEIHSQLV